MEETQEIQLTAKSELRCANEDNDQINGQQFYQKEIENPLSSDELDNAMEIQTNHEGQRDNKRDVSDEMSTRSSKRKSNDPVPNQSPEKEMFSKDFMFQSPDSQMKTQTKLSKLFD